MNFLRRYFERRMRQPGPWVRPWALLTPVVVLAIALPLLRPLRHPDPLNISDTEASLLASVQSLVERGTLCIDRSSFRYNAETIEVNGRRFSSQPPVFAVLLAGPYWVMHTWGWTLDEYSTFVPYMLTLLGVTLPVALGAGLIYRMSRLFELPRPKRALLALAVALGSGVLSYATVLNHHAPAAMGVLFSAACLIRLASSQTPGVAVALSALAGFIAALATAIEPGALLFLVLFGVVILSMRLPLQLRAVSAGLYLLGAVIPILVHGLLTAPLTGDLLPGRFHPELLARDTRPQPSMLASGRASSGPLLLSIETTTRADVEDTASIAAALDAPPPADASAAPAIIPPRVAEEDEEGPGFWSPLWTGAGWVLGALVGTHGVFSHFPILLLGVLGVTMVMHRHWPSSTKMLASTTIVGGATLLLLTAFVYRNPHEAGFASRWVVVVLPMTLFWAGVWLRKSHRPSSWAIVGVLLGFSVVVSIIGATGPLLPGAKRDEHSALSATRRLMQSPAEPRRPVPGSFADSR